MGPCSFLAIDPGFEFKLPVRLGLPVRLALLEKLALNGDLTGPVARLSVLRGGRPRMLLDP